MSFATAISSSVSAMTWASSGSSSETTGSWCSGLSTPDAEAAPSAGAAASGAPRTRSASSRSLGALVIIGTSGLGQSFRRWLVMQSVQNGVLSHVTQRNVSGLPQLTHTSPSGEGCAADAGVGKANAEVCVAAAGGCVAAAEGGGRKVDKGVCVAAAGGGNAPFAASLGGISSTIPAFALGASDPGAFGGTVDTTALPSPGGALALPSAGSFGNATGVSALEGAASENAAGPSGSTVDATAPPSGTLAGVATCGTSG